MKTSLVSRLVKTSISGGILLSAFAHGIFFILESFSHETTWSLSEFLICWDGIVWREVLGDIGVTSTAIFLFYNKCLWRIDPFNGIPVLARKYKVQIYSRHKNVQRTAIAEVSQTFIETKIQFYSEESVSSSISAEIVDEPPCQKLIYTYSNQSKSKFNEANPAHIGTVILNIRNKSKLTGTYFTSRNTQGDIEFLEINV